MQLRAGGCEVVTTPEHPFWVRGKGWLAAGEMRVGDQLVGADGQYVEVEGLVDAGVWAVVYNLRIAEHHTYFVGCEEWGFSAWAHNTCNIVNSTNRIVLFATQAEALSAAKTIAGIPSSLLPTQIYRFVTSTQGLGTITQHGVSVTTLQAVDFEPGEWQEYKVPGVGYRYIVHHPRPAEADHQTMGIGHYHVGKPKQMGMDARLVPQDPNRNRYENVFPDTQWEHIAYER